VRRFNDRETCLARVTAAACIAFQIICLWSYSPLSLSFSLCLSLSLSLSLPISCFSLCLPPWSCCFCPAYSYLFMPHVKSQQAANIFSFYSVIRSAKRWSYNTTPDLRSPTPCHLHSTLYTLPSTLFGLYPLRLARCVGSFWNFYTHSWLFRLVMFNALGHMCCIPAELVLLHSQNGKKIKNQTKKKEDKH